MKRGERGFTLLELMAGGAILGVVLAASLSAIQAGQGVTGRGMSQSDLEDRCRRVVDKIAGEMVQAGAGTVFPEVFFGVTTIAFTQAEDYSGGAVVWGDPISYGLQYAFNETDDGTDENGNGLVDDQEITRQQGAEIISICSGVQEGGLTFSRSGDTITVSLTLESLDSDQRLMQRNVQTTVQLRN